MSSEALLFFCDWSHPWNGILSLAAILWERVGEIGEVRKRNKKMGKRMHWRSYGRRLMELSGL